MRLRSWMRPAAAEIGDLEDVLGDVDGDGYVAHGMGSFRHRSVIGVSYQG
jgi:hypothetical protein